MAHSFLLCLSEPIFTLPTEEPSVTNIIKMITDNIVELSSVALNLMLESICNVDSKYVVEFKSPVMPEEEEKIVEQVERCFAYELYHQLRLQFEDYDKSKEIVISAEIPKCCSGKEASIKYPDLVIHGGQTNQKLQLLVCEIKRYTGTSQSCKKKIAKDLTKLGEYICNLQYENGPIGFDAGCFIMTNISKTDLYSLVKGIIKNKKISIKRDSDIIDLSEIANRITLVSYELTKNSKHVEKIPLIDIYNEK